MPINIKTRFTKLNARRLCGSAKCFFRWKYAAPSVLFACIFAAMLFFNFYTPLLCDDYAYAFNFSDGSRIERIADILPSMTAHRIYANGRVFSHFFVQLFVMTGKSVFNIVNALVSTGLIAVLYAFIKSENRISDIVCMLAEVFLIWCFTPDFGQTFLWLSGSCNYSWAMFFTLLFIYPYCISVVVPDKRVFRRNLIYCILFLAVAAIAGGYSESASLAAIFTAACLMAYNRVKRRKTDILLLCGLIFSALGYVFLMSAPSELTGRSASAVFDLTGFLYNLLYTVSFTLSSQKEMYCIFAFLFIAGITYKIDGTVIFISTVLFLGGVGSAAAFAFAKYCPPRALITTTVYTTLAIALLLKALWTKTDKRIICACIAVLGVVFLCAFAKGAYDIAINNTVSNRRTEIIAEAKLSGDKTAVLPVYTPATKYFASAGNEEIAEYWGNWINAAMANYYGLDYVVAEGAQR